MVLSESAFSRLFLLFWFVHLLGCLVVFRWFWVFWLLIGSGVAVFRFFFLGLADCSGVFLLEKLTEH